VERKIASEETVVLRALASPVRQEILDLLGRGSATSAMLARFLSSNTGVMSYHLRELGNARLIERDEERSRGREIYWRLGSGDVRFNDPASSDQPEMAQAAIDLIMSRLAGSVRAYVSRTDLDPGWRDAALFSRSAARLTVAELAQFNKEYLALVRRWTQHRRAAVDARPIRLAMFAYPDETDEESATGT
jgi:DNA-binding transcriptional ArsR family regulator